MKKAAGGVLHDREAITNGLSWGRLCPRRRLAIYRAA
jgi:hypothetical protein